MNTEEQELKCGGLGSGQKGVSWIEGQHGQKPGVEKLRLHKMKREGYRWPEESTEWWRMSSKNEDTLEDVKIGRPDATCRWKKGSSGRKLMWWDWCSWASAISLSSFSAGETEVCWLNCFHDFNIQKFYGLSCLTVTRHFSLLLGHKKYKVSILHLGQL